MTLRLVRNFSRQLVLRPATEAELGGEHFTLRFGHAFKEEESTAFAVVFEVKVLLEEGLALTTEYYSIFESSEVVTEGRANFFL